MSITKIGKAKSSSDAIEYILKEEKNDEKKPNIIGGNVAGSTVEDIKREFRFQEKLNFKVKNTITHISVSFPVGKTISNKLANNYADELINQLGFSDNPYLVVRHFDKDERETEPYAHIHIVASRIKNDGSLISEWKMAERTIEIAQEIDKNYELQSAQYYTNSQAQRQERNIKKNEYRVMLKTGKLSILEEFKDVADEALQHMVESQKSNNLFESKTQFFVSELQQKGFEVLPFISKTEQQMKGFSFKKDKIVFTASKAGKKFSWTNLATQLEYNREKDFQFLVKLQTEVLTESDKKVLPTDGNVNPNSSENEFREKVEQNELKHTHSELQETQNEKTNQFTDNKSTSKPSESIKQKESGNRNIEKKESNSETEIPKLENTARNESDSGLAKTEFIRKESSEIWDAGATHQTIGSREIVIGDKETTSINNRADLAANRIDEEAINNRRFSNSESNQNSQTTIERTELENSDFESERDRSQQSLGDFDQELSKSQTEFSEFQSTSRESENRISQPRESEQHFDFGNSVNPKHQIGSGKLEFESDDFRTNSTNITNAEKDRLYSEENFESSNRDDELRAKKSELGKNLHENSVSLHSAIDPHLIDHNLSKPERGISQSKSRTETELRNVRAELSRTEEFHSNTLLRQTENDSDVSPGEEIYTTTAGATTETNSSERSTNSQTAKITAQVINVKFFSAQLDEQIVEKWAKLIEKSDAEYILHEVIKPKMSEENTNFTKQIETQAELIAENLNIQKPAFSQKPNLDKLANTLTKIETTNYTNHNGIEVNAKTVNRLAQEKAELVKLSLKHTPSANSSDYLAKLDGIPFSISFNSEFERQVFNSLLEPQKVKFDTVKMLETQESVSIDEVAANETVRLIQIAYGAQNNKFTNSFKADLAEQIYQQPQTASKIYESLKDFDWQKTLQTFTPLVNNLAEQNGFKFEPPQTEAEKNQLLAQNMAQAVIQFSQTNSETVDKNLQNCISQDYLNYANKSPFAQQLNLTANLMDNSLETPTFKSSLENTSYNFAKIDDDKKAKYAESIVEKVKTKEKIKEEKQREEQKMQIEMELLMGSSNTLSR